MKYHLKMRNNQLHPVEADYFKESLQGNLQFFKKNAELHELVGVFSRGTWTAVVKDGEESLLPLIMGKRPQNA